MTAPTPSSSALASAWKRWPGQVLRWLLTVVPVLWIARRVELGSIASAFTHVDPLRFTVAALLLGVSIGAGTLRWQLLLRAYSTERCPSLAELFVHNLVASYMSLLPGGLLGDAVRGFRVRRALPDLLASYGIVVVERVSSLFGLLAVTLVATLVTPELRERPIALPIYAAALVGGVLGSAVLALPGRLEAHASVRARVGRLPWVGSTLLRLKPLPAGLSLLTVHACSVLATAIAVIGIGFAVSPLAPQASVTTLYAVIPVVLLLTFIPITPGAIGQREAVWVALLSFTGVPTHAALAVSFVVLALGLCYPAIGGLYYLVETLRAQRRRAQDNENPGST